MTSQNPGPSDSRRDVAVITGAGSGIGAALTAALAHRGVGVMLMGRDASKLAHTQRALPAGVPVWTITGDLGEASACDRQIQAIRQALDATTHRLRYLVHNAGVGEPAADVETMDPADLSAALAVNVTAPLAITQALLPYLKVRDDARVLLVGAGIADRPQPGTGSYGISKKALARLFEQLQTDFAAAQAPTWPHLALFQPGLVDTAGLREHLESARRCGLPHTEYLDHALAEGECRYPVDVGRTMADALTRLPAAEYHGATLRPPMG